MIIDGVWILWKLLLTKEKTTLDQNYADARCSAICRMLKSLSGKWEKVQVGIGVSEIYRRGLLHLTWAFQQQQTSPEPSNSSAVVSQGFPLQHNIVETWWKWCWWYWQWSTIMILLLHNPSVDYSGRVWVAEYGVGRLAARARCAAVNRNPLHRLRLFICL